jgi:hypothetical protein
MKQTSALGVHQRIVAYLDGLPYIGDLRQAMVNVLRELSSLMPSILDKAFRRGL